MSVRFPVTFAPLEAVAWVEPGTTVLAAASIARIALQAPCGGRGICGACGVRVLDGSLEAPGETETRILSTAGPGIRLACHARVVGPVRVKPIIAAQRSEAVACIPEGGVGVAVDLGTTSISAVAIDPVSGAEWGRATVQNPQSVWGSDVMSRLGAAIGGHSAELAAAATAGILEVVDGATAGHPEAVEALVIAGNTASVSLLAGVDVGSLAVAPYDAPTGIELDSDARLRAGFEPGTRISLVPPVASFVGGDVAAGIVACAMLEPGSGPRMLVDIGTNAEVALTVDGRLIVASAAAGPAFEGASISCGGVAAPGAATTVRIESDGAVKLDVIGRGRARWLSGAALISAVAELRRIGQLDQDGRLLEHGPLSARISADDAGVRRVDLGDAAQPLFLTQLDIRALQLAKAAVLVAIQRVLTHARIDAASLERFWVAGAFGAAMRPADLVELGIVPGAVSSVISVAGNTALQGAVEMLVDETKFGAAADLALIAEHVDLAGDAAFAAALIAATRLVEVGSE